MTIIHEDLENKLEFVDRERKKIINRIFLFVIVGLMINCLLILLTYNKNSFEDEAMLLSIMCFFLLSIIEFRNFKKLYNINKERLSLKLLLLEQESSLPTSKSTTQ